MCDKTPKRTSENQVKISLVVKTMVSYVIDVEVSQTVANRVRLWTRNVTSLRNLGQFAKICKSKTEPRSGMSDQHNSFCENESKLSCQTSSEMEMGMYCTRENMFNMSTTWEYITVKDHRVKMQVDPGDDSTGILQLVWTELAKH